MLGAAHLVQRLSLKRFKDARQVDDLGGIITNSNAHEITTFGGDILRSHTDLLVGALAEIVQSPVFAEEDLLAEKAVLPEILQPHLQDPAFFLPEVFREVAFGPGLGNAVVCGEDSLRTLTPEHLSRWVRDMHVGRRMVIAGVNVRHEEFLPLVQRHFGRLPAGEAVRDQPAVYKGGEARLEGDPKEKATKDPTTHMMLGWQAPSGRDTDYFVVALINALLGGGKNFSTGGPGKGMYTHLNMRVMNKYHWAQSVESFYSCFTDTGLFGVLGSSDPEYAGRMLKTICAELLGLVHHIDPLSFERAKAMLKGSIYMNLENRRVVCEDIGYQLIFGRERLTGAQLCDRIDALKGKELQAVLARMLASPPTLVAQGTSESLKQLPTLAAVQKIMKGESKFSLPLWWERS
jgi:processing peptidase subunit alpha